MTSHELAKKLLSLPDLKVMVRDCIGPKDISYCYEYIVSGDDSDMCGDCEDIVGQTIIAIE